MLTSRRCSDPSVDAEGYRYELADKRYRTTGRVDENQSCRLGSVRDRRDSAEILTVGVVPAARRHGIGARLLAMLVDEACGGVRSRPSWRCGTTTSARSGCTSEPVRRVGVRAVRTTAAGPTGGDAPCPLSRWCWASRRSVVTRRGWASSGHQLARDAIASSVDEHARFGGVVPEVGQPGDLQAMVPTLRRACADAGVTPHDLDAMPSPRARAAGALLVGVAAARRTRWRSTSALRRQPPVLARRGGPARERSLDEPCVALLVSGGHSSLLFVPRVGGEDVTSSAPPSTTPPARP